jgi:hypothetical protein
LVNQVLPKSFGRKETSKTAIHDQEWYPANRMLLHDVDILKTKAASSTATRNESAEEEAAVTVTTNHEMEDISDISNVSNSASSTTTTASLLTATAASALDLPDTTAASALELPNNRPSSTTRKALDKMTFESGLTGDFKLNILQHLVKKESVCENLHQRYEENTLGEATYRGAALYKVRHVALDGEVLALREVKEQEKTDERDQVVKNAIDEFKKRKGEYEKVKNSPKLVDN